MSESVAKPEKEFLRALGRAFVIYSRKHAGAPDCEGFVSFLNSQGLTASVSLIYRREAGDEVYYSERLQSPAIYWRVRLGAWNYLLPRPVNQEQFSETKDFSLAPMNQAHLTPASLGECIPAILGLHGDDWEVNSPGRLSAGEPPPFSQPHPPVIRVAHESRGGKGSVPPPPSESGAADAFREPNHHLAAGQVARAYVTFCAAVCAGEEQAQVDSLCEWIGRSLKIKDITREEVRFGGETQAEQGFWPCSLFEYPHPEPEAWLLAWCDASQKWQGLLLPVIKDASRFSKSPVAFAPHDQTPNSLVCIVPGRVTQLENYGWELAIQGSLLGMPARAQVDLARCYLDFRASRPRPPVAQRDFFLWVSRWFDSNEDVRKRLAGNRPEVWPVAPHCSDAAGSFLEIVEPGHEQYWLVFFPVTKIGAVFPSFTDQFQTLDDAGEAFSRVPPKQEMNSVEECIPALARVLPGEQRTLLEVLRKGRIAERPSPKLEQPDPSWKRLLHKVGIGR